MPSFDDITATRAEGLLREPADLETNRAYVGAPTAEHPDGREPDHWQGGAGYSAPLPAAGDPSRTVYMTALEATFVTEDCLSDVLERRRNGLLGKEPQWSFEPDDSDEPGPDTGNAASDGDDAPDGSIEVVDSKGVSVVRTRTAQAQAEDDAEEADPAEDPVMRAKLDRIDKAMAAWWERTQAHDVLKRFADGIGYAGRSYLRIFVPHGRLTVRDDGSAVIADAATPEDVLRSLYVEHVDPDAAVLHRDRATMLQLGVVVTTDDADQSVEPEGGEGDASVELTYLASPDPGAKTVIRTVTETTDEPAAMEPDGSGITQRMEVDLRGKLTLFEGKGRPLLDPSSRSNQKDLNTTRTMLAISNHKAGFPSLVFINVKPPTQQVLGADGEYREEPVNYENGPGSAGFFTSYEDADGKLVPGSVTQFGPVENENLRESAQVARVALYRRAKQLHALALEGANLSGEAMIQGQGEYLLDLVEHAGVVNRAGAWMLETVWAFAEVLATGKPPSKDVRAAFECRVHAGPLSAALRQAVLEQYEDGLLSKVTAMSLLGVDDVDAETERMKAERAEEAEEGMSPLDRLLLGTANAETATDPEEATA